MNVKKNNALGSLLLLLTAVIWGLAFSMQEMAAKYVDPFSVLFFRSAIAALFLIPVILLFDCLGGKKRRLFSVINRRPVVDIRKKEWIGGAVSGAFLALATLLQQMGIGETGAGLGGFITSLYMVLVPLIGLLFGQKIGLKKGLCVVVAVFGFYLISVSGAVMPATGDLLILACAVVFALQIVAIDRLSSGCDGLRFSFVQFLTCTAVSCPFMLIFGSPSAEAIRPAIFPLLFLGILSSGVAYTLQILGQQRMTSPVVAGLIMSLENVFSLIGAMILNPENNSLSARQYVGCALIFLTVVFTQIPIFEPRSAEASDREKP